MSTTNSTAELPRFLGKHEVVTHLKEMRQHLWHTHMPELRADLYEAYTTTGDDDYAKQTRQSAVGKGWWLRARANFEDWVHALFPGVQRALDEAERKTQWAIRQIIADPEMKEGIFLYEQTEGPLHRVEKAWINYFKYAKENQAAQAPKGVMDDFQREMAAMAAEKPALRRMKWFGLLTP